MEPGSFTSGCILTFGASMYLFGATVELPMHFLDEMQTSLKNMLLIMLSFSVGCVAIGLVLLDHEHCEVSTSGGGSSDSGHNH